MWTRKQYMNHECTHDQYYSSVLNSLGKGRVDYVLLMLIPRQQLLASTDEHFNDIPLSKWDAGHEAITRLVRWDMMEQTWNGEPPPRGTVYWSLSDSVCVLKQAAKEFVESYHDR